MTAWTRRALLVMLLLLCPAGVWAETVDHMASGDEVILSDGRIVRLAAVKGWPEAVPFLQTRLSGREIVLQNAVSDRYGRVEAVMLVDGVSVAELLLREGLAFVYPAVGDDLEALLAEERAARQAGRGVWPAHGDVAAEDADRLCGSYGFVIGVVVNAVRIKNKFYVNFGADWRKDFAVQIAAHDLRAFKKQGVDPLLWQGKRLRVRGWVRRGSAPMIVITDPQQVETF